MAATIFTLKFRTKNAFRSVDSDLTTHSMILDSISRRFVVALNLQNSFPAGSFPRDGWMDGWMICDFTSFSTVFQSYQDDGRMIMKGCVQWNPVYG